MKHIRSGFTLVELLITIVILGILASITVVSYQGLQSRAHDAVVQAELRNIGQSLELYMLETGSYPSLANFPAITAPTASPRLSVSISKGSYEQLEYCYSYFATQRDNYAMIANSKSGNKFYVRHDSAAPKRITSSSFTPCPDGMPDEFGMPSPIHSLVGKSGGTWSTWVR